MFLSTNFFNTFFRPAVYKPMIQANVSSCKPTAPVVTNWCQQPAVSVPCKPQPTCQPTVQTTKITLNVTDQDCDNMPTASGVTAPYSTVTITWPNGTQSKTMAGANGKYSIEAPTMQPAGSVSAVATNKTSGSSKPATGSFVPSDSGNGLGDPTIIASDEDKDHKPTASGTAEPGTTVTVTWPDGSKITTLTDAKGNYSVESLTVQATGKVSAVASSGGCSCQTTSNTVSTTFTDTGSNTGPCGLVEITIAASDPDADDKPTATGVTTPNVVVTVTWPDGTTSTTVSDANGKYSIESLTEQTTGRVTAQVVDKDGKWVSAGTTYYDKTAPDITVAATDGDNDDKPTATGTTDANAVVTITWPDGSKTTTMSDAKGNYSVEAPTTQLPGTIGASVTDVAGNTGKAVTTYADLNPPTVSVTAADPDKDDRPTATGTTEPGLKVTVTWPDGSTITTTADASGKYSVESLTPQTSGTVTAKVTDAAGNTANAKAPYADVTAPTITVTATDPDADDKPTATGTTEPGRKVTITWPDGSTDTTTSDANGKYSVESTNTQTSGTVTANVTDLAGNTASATGPYKDVTLPKITVTATDTDNDDKPTATGTTEPNSIVTIKWPDGSTITTTSDATGKYSVESLTTQANGQVQATVADKAGNTASAKAPYADTTLPFVTVTATDPDDDDMPTATGQTDPNTKVTITWPDGSTSVTTSDANGKYSVESTTKQDSGTVTAKVSDTSGNTASAKAPYADTTAPTVTVKATDPDGDDKPTATGKTEPGLQVTVTWPDGTTSVTTADANGNYSVESLTKQNGGTVTSKVADAAGNSATAQDAYNDTTAPTVSVKATDPDGDDKPTASGTTEPGLKVTVTWPDGSTSVTTADANGNYSVESLTKQNAGTVTSKVSDAAGNTATAQDKYADVTAPTVSVKATDPDGDDKPTATGTTEPGLQVTVTWPDGTTSVTTADANGNYSVESLTKQNAGTVTSKVADAAGNTATAQDKYADVTAPTVSVKATDPDGDDKPTATGTTEPGLQVTVTWPDGTTSVTTADANGNYSVESLTKQNAGTVTSKVSDAAGNTATAKDVYSDTTAPAVSVKATDPDGDDKPTATGTTEPGLQVTVTWPDGTTSVTTADANGNYSVESLTKQNTGTVTSKVTDAAGNTATAQDKYSDVTSPSVSVTATDTDGDDKPTATGTTEPGLQVTVTWPDGTTSITTADANGNYSVESTTTQTSGSVTSKVTDAAGNTATAKAPYSDVTAPAVTVTATDPDGDSKPTATGTTEPGLQVTITWPDGTTSVTTADATGKYSVESLTVQASGTVSAVAKDAAGNTGTAKGPYTDVTEPIISVEPTDPDLNGKINVTGTTEPGLVVTVTFPTGEIVTTVANSSGVYKTESLTTQPAGSVTATVKDPSGNTGSSTGSYSDKTAPAVTVTANDPDGDNKPTATGTTEPNLKVTITWPDGTTSVTTADATGKYTVESSTVQASGTVSAVATDASGNTGTAKGPYTDITAPAITVTPTDPEGNGKINVTGTTEPGLVVTVTFPTGEIITTTANSSGVYTTESLTIQPTGSVTATVKDPSGNTGTGTGPYTDKTAPAVTVTATDPDGDNKPTATGTTEPGLQVTITWPDGTTSVTTADATGKYTVESTTVQASGTVSAVAKDAAGNTGTAKGPYTDVTAPSITVEPTDPEGNGKINVTGTTEPGLVVTVTFPTGEIVTTTANSSGVYTTESLTTQPTGSVTATVKDPSGNTGTGTGSYADKTAPAVTVTATDPDGDNKPTATGTTEPGLKVTITWPDGTTSVTTADATGKYTVESTTVQASGTVSAVATDAAGNTGTAKGPYTDITAPAITVTPTDPDGNGKVNVTGTTEPGLVVTVTFPTGEKVTTIANSSGVYTTESLTIQPSGSVTATVTDPSGNSGTSTGPYTDKTAPTVSVSAIDTDGDDKPTATGTTEPGLQVTVTWPDGTTSVTTADANGNYSVESTTTQVTGTVTAVARDAAGNTGKATGPYTDVTAPAVTVTAIDTDNDDKPTASGTTQPSMVVTITWPDGTTSVTTSDANGNYSVESTTTQVSGNVVANVTDQAGNKATANTTYKDVTLPKINVAAIDDDADDKPTATGTTEPNLKVTITWPDGTTIVTTADATGKYSVESLTVQNTGTVTATTTDQAGNSATAQGPYRDVTAPVILTLFVDDTYNETSPDNAPRAYGTTSPNTKLTITWTDGDTITTMSNSVGYYEVEAKYDQLSGIVNVVATDSSGNTSLTKSDNFVSRPLEPTIVLASDSGNEGDWATNDTTPSYQIQSITAFDAPHLYVDGVEVASVYDAVNHTITPVEELSFGTHKVQLGFSSGTENGILSANVHNTTIYKSSITTDTSIVTNNIIRASDLPLTLKGKTSDVYNADADAETVSVNIQDILGHQVFATGVVAADGTWSISNVDLTSLTSGNIYINATASDNYGGTVSDTDIFSLRLI